MRRHRPVPSRALLALCALAPAFAVIAAVVAVGATRDLDASLLLALRHSSDPTVVLGPAWLPETLRDVTSLGSSVVLWSVVIAACGHLALARRWRDVAFLALTAGGGQVVVFMAKAVFDRARPELAANAPRVFTTSFPSSHATLSLAIYVALALLLTRSGTGRAHRRLAVWIAGIATAATGISRVALGVHWPTDVLAGWCLGGVWTALCVLALGGGCSSRRLLPDNAHRVDEP